MLHAQIVEALEALAGDRINDQIERLAHHALRGEVWDKARLYYCQAGAKAVLRSANQEAVACFEQALSALQHLPESHDTITRGIDVRLALRNALLPLGEYKRIIDTLREAERLAEGLDDPYRLVPIYAYLTHYFWSMRDLDHALAYGQRALALAEPLGDVKLFILANFVLAEVHYRLGHYEQAIAAFEQNVARLTGDLLYLRTGPAVSSVVSRRWLAQALAETGAFAEGISRGEEAIRIAEAADHPYSLANACWSFGVLYIIKGDFQKAIPLMERTVELCRVWNLRQILAVCTLTLGHVLALFGQVSNALALLEQSEATIDRLRQSNYVGMLSEVYWRAGRYEDAQTLAAKAYERVRETKERGALAWAARLLGELHRHSDSPEVGQTETYYQQALALANELGMRPLQAHCHRGLGTLYSQTGQSEQARVELSTAIEMYHDMEMTFWLPETEAALVDVERKV